MNRPETVKDQILRMRGHLENNLKFLCTEYLNTKDWSSVHNDLEVFLRHAGPRVHIELPRGHLKSWIVTQGWAIQQMLKNPDIRILIANAVESNATKMLRFIRTFLGAGGYLSKFYGPFETDIWSQEELQIRQRRSPSVAPTFMAAGLQKTLTSQHFDLIIADDIVEPENVRTKEQREKVYEFYLSLFDLLEPKGRIVVIGTRYHQDDLYARILEENGLHQNWSLFVRSCYTADGSVLFPEKFTHEKLDDIKKKSFYHFSTQYLNNPIDPENADFKASQIKFYDPTTPNPSSLYLTVDPAISLSRDADFSAGTVAGMFADRRIRVVDYFRKRCVPSDLVDEIFLMVKKWRLHRIGIETFGYQKTLKYDIQRQQRERGVFFSVDELGKSRNTNKENAHTKEETIRRLQPFFEQGLIEIRRDMQELVDELLAFPRGKHDDLCLAAGTLIATQRGAVPIEEITTRDWIIGPLGLRSVLYAGPTGKKQVIPFFGTSITPTHKVFTYKNGFSPFDTLTYQDDFSKLSLWELLRWAYRSKLYSMALHTDLWGRDGIILASRAPIRGGSIPGDCMWRFGSFIRARRFLWATTFITAMATRLITTTKIWSVFRLKNTTGFLKKLIVRGCVRTWNGSDLLRQSGIGLLRAVRGIVNTQRINGPILDYEQLLAGNAGVNFKRPWYGRYTVLDRALHALGEPWESMISPSGASSVEENSNLTDTSRSAPVPFPAVENSSGLVNVYNLEVEDGCYFANGILVSNCDALSYQLDYLVPSLGLSKPAPVLAEGTMGWWIKNKMPEQKMSIYDKFFQDVRSA